MHLHGVICVALRQQVCGGQSRDAQNDRQTMGEKSPERKRENRKWLPFNCDGLLRKAVALAQRTLGRVGVSIHTRHVLWKEHSLSIRSSRSRKWFARFLANAHRSNIQRTSRGRSEPFNLNNRWTEWVTVWEYVHRHVVHVPDATSWAKLCIGSWCKFTSWLIFYFNCQWSHVQVDTHQSSPLPPISLLYYSRFSSLFSSSFMKAALLAKENTPNCKDWRL